MSTPSVIAIAKSEVLDPHRILENDIDNFTANHEARAVLLQRALNDSCSYAEQLWDTLNALRQYLLGCLPPDPRTTPEPIPNRPALIGGGAAPTGPDDEQGWQNWITAFAAATSVLCGPHGDSGFGRSRAQEEARRRRRS
jgi:hypothetical protein